jgi:tetraprenyl-beta-curcumene synthase
MPAGTVEQVAPVETSRDTVCVSGEPDARVARSFLTMVRRYLLSVFPTVARELAHWHTRAQHIPSPALRSLALEALAKRGNMEGAALFAAFTPRRHRREVVRALVAFQAAYNYLDNLAEQPNPDPARAARQLHLALLEAVGQPSAEGDYYVFYRHGNDGGYLAAMVERCREALATLPSLAVVEPFAQAAARRIVEFQSRNLSRCQGGQDALEGWARAQLPDGELDWWEVAAASGSSLAVYALIAAAAQANLEAAHAVAIEAAYFPSIGALHSLLDSLVDIAEDQRSGQRNLLEYYDSPAHATAGLISLAQRARATTARLPNSAQHTAVLTAMMSYYLSAPTARSRDADVIARRLIRPAGDLARVVLALFRAARFASRLVRGPATQLGSLDAGAA